MVDCRYKKILQFYLDGSRNGHDFAEVEEHLKTCPRCQLELAELAELNGAALEIVDQAPDKEYWESFVARVRNRVLARSIEPKEATDERRLPWYSVLRMASVLVALALFIAGSIFVVQRGLAPDNPGIIVNAPERVIERVVDSPASDNAKNAAPNLSKTAGEPDQNRIPFAAESEPAQSEGVISVPTDQAGADQPVETKDVTVALRQTKAIGEKPPALETEIKSYSRSTSSSYAEMDRSFRMKIEFVSQRLMAGLAGRPHPIIFQGSSFGYASQGGAEGNVTPANESSALWGYTRIYTDTSESAEMRKYFLELELMESK
jgi:hypothetical protein